MTTSSTIRAAAPLNYYWRTKKKSPIEQFLVPSYSYSHYYSFSSSSITSCSWLKLANQTAIITGAASGIGASIARALSLQHCNVLLLDTNEEAVKHIVDSILQVRDNNGNKDDNNDGHVSQQVKVKYALCDVTNEHQVQNAIQLADQIASSSSSFKAASILINAAGITSDSMIHKLTVQDYDSVLDTNLKGTFLTCRAFCQPMRLRAFSGESCGGSIVNIGSIVAKAGNVAQVNYAASKGGVIGLTRALAKEMAFLSGKSRESGEDGRSDGNNDTSLSCLSSSMPLVRVNAIQPGFIDTPMSRAVPAKVRDGIQRKIALRRFGRVEDVANLALFLASSERSGYVTGQCWDVDGMISL